MFKQPRARLIAVIAAGTGLVAGLGFGIASLASASTSTAVGTHSRHGDRVHRGDRHHRNGGAVVHSVNGTASITLDTPRGVKTVAVTSATVYKRGTATVSLVVVKPGEVVRVAFVDPKATSLVAKAVRIEPARAPGTSPP